MNKVKKLICACLILAMCFNTATVPVAGRIFTIVGETWGPLHIDILPALAATGYKDYITTIYLTISGDMVFKGKIMKLSNEELDKLCKEALAYIGETAETVKAGENAYNKLVEECKAMYERAAKDFGRANADKTVRDAVIANLPANLQIAGTGAQVIEDIVAGEVDLDTGATVASTLLSLKTGVLFGLSAAATATLLTSVAISLAKNVGFSRMVDRVIELEQQVYAYNDFIEILKRKLNRHKGTQTIIFTDAKATQKFTLFGKQCNENWTLNMTLATVRTDVDIETNTRSTLYEGTYYDGTYTINIEYDINNFRNNMKSVIQDYGWLDNYAYQAWVAAWNLNLVQTSAGAGEATRRLEGSALAFIPRLKSASSITPSQTGDQKYVDISGITLSSTGPGRDTPESVLNSEYTVSADEDTFYFDVSKWIVTARELSTGDLSGRVSPTEIPWDGNIWKRGDNAGNGWKIRIVE